MFGKFKKKNKNYSKFRERNPEATKEFIKNIKSRKQKCYSAKKFKFISSDLEMKYFDSNLANSYIEMNKNLF